VVTPGWFDLRYLPGRVGFPADLHGRRCLDVGKFDGLSAFAMERRGAAEVVALDVPDAAEWDWPVGAPPEAITGFPLAREALGSSVQRVERTIYALDPEVDGTFDFVYVGLLLLHLRDPVGRARAGYGRSAAGGCSSSTRSRPSGRETLGLMRSRAGRELLFAGRVGGPHLAVHAQVPTNSSGSLPAGPK
jgi:hypothetical protein